jgi:hypothetical protein
MALLRGSSSVRGFLDGGGREREVEAGPVCVNSAAGRLPGEGTGPAPAVVAGCLCPAAAAFNVLDGLLIASILCDSSN